MKVSLNCKMLSGHEYMVLISFSSFNQLMKNLNVEQKRNIYDT